MTNTETDEIRERMTDEELRSAFPYTTQDINAEIARLKALKASLTPKNTRTTKTPKPTVKRHTRQVRCSNCGETAKRTEMIQVSRHEYQHPMCPMKHTRIVRIDFTL